MKPALSNPNSATNKLLFFIFNNLSFFLIFLGGDDAQRAEGNRGENHRKRSRPGTYVSLVTFLFCFAFDFARTSIKSFYVKLSRNTSFVIPSKYSYLIIHSMSMLVTTAGGEGRHQQRRS